MGALEGSLSFKTYYVEGEPPNDFHADYLSRIQRRFFQPLSPIGDEERSMGWVPVQDPLAVSAQRHDIFFNQYILLALRIDKWSIPSAWLKAIMRQALAERFPDKNIKISKRAKEEVRLQVVTDIKHKILPAMKTVDLVWNISERRLRFWSTSNALCEEFAEFFEETFGLRLTPDSPYMMAKNLGLSDADLNRMLSIEPWYPGLTHQDSM